MKPSDRKLIFDLSIFSIQERGGISVVWKEITRRINRWNPNNFSIEYWIPDQDNLFFDANAFSTKKTKKIGRQGKFGKYLPKLTLGRPQDILHTSYYTWYPFYRGKLAVTVHDFTHELHMSGLQRLAHNFIKRRSINNADIVICISESTRNDLLKFYPGIAKTKSVHVVYNSFSEEFHYDPNLEKLEGPEYFLWVGGRSGYKNFSLALSRIAHLNENGHKYNLVVVGAPLNDQEKREIAELGLLPNVIVKSNVKNDQLRTLYSNAVALLYLSRYEGFGLPILEAQRCLCPVICLPIPASKEVGENSVLYLEQDEKASLTALLDFLHKDKSRAHLEQAGLENTRRFSWGRSVAELIKIYESS